MSDDKFEALRKRVADKMDANTKRLNEKLKKRLPEQRLAATPQSISPTQADIQAASAKFTADIAPLPLGTNTTPMAGRPAAPTGTWRCIVNSNIVSIDLTANINANGSLLGKGTIVYLGTSRIVNVQGQGDWVALPPDASSPEWLFKFRMHPSNHAIFSWYARPTESPNHLRHRFVMPDQSGTVETTCERIG